MITASLCGVKIGMWGSNVGDAFYTGRYLEEKAASRQRAGRQKKLGIEDSMSFSL